MKLYVAIFVFLIIILIIREANKNNKYYGYMEVASWFTYAALWIETLLASCGVFLNVITGVLFVSALFRGEEHIKAKTNAFTILYCISLLGVTIYLLAYYL